MIKSFGEYPPILQKQILIRLAAGIAAYMILPIIWLCNGGLELMLPFICFGTVFLIGAVQLYARCEEKGYVVIRGICTQVDRTGLRRRLKDIYVKEKQFTVRIVRPAMWIRSFHVGDTGDDDTCDGHGSHRGSPRHENGGGTINPMEQLCRLPSDLPF